LVLHGRLSPCGQVQVSLSTEAAAFEAGKKLPPLRAPDSWGDRSLPPLLTALPSSTTALKPDPRSCFPAVILVCAVVLLKRPELLHLQHFSGGCGRAPPERKQNSLFPRQNPFRHISSSHGRIVRVTALSLSSFCWGNCGCVLPLFSCIKAGLLQPKKHTLKLPIITQAVRSPSEPPVTVRASNLRVSIHTPALSYTERLQIPRESVGGFFTFPHGLTINGDISVKLFFSPGPNRVLTLDVFIHTGGNPPCAIKNSSSLPPPSKRGTENGSRASCAPAPLPLE